MFYHLSWIAKHTRQHVKYIYAAVIVMVVIFSPSPAGESVFLEELQSSPVFDQYTA